MDNWRHATEAIGGKEGATTAVKGKRDRRMATSATGPYKTRIPGDGKRSLEPRCRRFSDRGPKYIEGPFEAVEDCGLRWAMRVTRLPDGVGFRPWILFRGEGGLSLPR